MTLEDGTAADVDVVLHEERVHVDVARESMRLLVRRRIVTETRTIEVVVRREVLEVEELPAEASGMPVSAEPRAAQSLVLSQEVPVVSLQVQPYERVTLEVRPVHSDVNVTTTSGEERVELTTDLPA